MRISVIGTGYVGLVTGTCFADMGNDVICVDIDAEKISKLKSGIVPIYEPGLEELVRKNQTAGRLNFTTDIGEAVRNSEICFIAVGTPSDEDGSADLKYILAVASDLGKYINKQMVIINKSTVPVGTAKKVKEVISNGLKNRGVEYGFDVVSNPEFLKEGTALDDFFKPDRIIIGVDNCQSRKAMEDLYAPFVRSGAPVMFMSIQSAEMSKYAANAMLATKVSFINEIANLCNVVGADVEEVRRGIGADKRIGPHFIYPGIGYGGSCFPKDIGALARVARENNTTASIIEAVEEVNNKQKERLVAKILNFFNNDVGGKIFAVWGLSFKPNTDDMREAPSVIIIRKLLELGAKIRAFDPKAISEAKKIFGDQIIFTIDNYQALENVEAMILTTEWGDFREPDFERMKSLMRSPVIFDGRNQYDPEKMKELGFKYFCIGRPAYN